MGGCASKPKDADLNPTEVPATPKNKAEAETINPEGNNNGGESQKENAAPLVDLSESEEPKQEAGGDSDSTTAPSKPAEPEAAQVADLTAQLTTQPEKVEALAKESEDKSEATVHTQTKEPAKEGQPKADSDSDTTPTSEHKTIAPVVAV